MSAGAPRWIASLLILSAGTLAPAESPDDALASRDAKIRSGWIEYGVEVPPPLDPPPGADIPFTQERRTERLAFSADGRFMARLRDSRARKLGVLSRTFVQGPRWRYIEEERKGGVRITFPGDAGWTRTNNPRFTIVAGPSFPLAANLSGRGWRRVGLREWTSRDFDGAQLTVRIAPDGVPERLLRSVDNRLVNTWTYDGRLRAAPDLLLPRRSVYRFDWNGRSQSTEFTIRAADLSREPSEAELTTR